jgi:hypothetical protein
MAPWSLSIVAQVSYLEIPRLCRNSGRFFDGENESQILLQLHMYMYLHVWCIYISSDLEWFIMYPLHEAKKLE